MAVELRSKKQLSDLAQALNGKRIYMPVNNKIFNEFYDRVIALKPYDKTYSIFMDNVNYCIKMCTDANGDRIKFKPIARSISQRGYFTGWLLEMVILKNDETIKSVFIYGIG